MAENKNVQDWLRDGEALYARLLAEYDDGERQIREIESRLVAKANEINQLAQLLGKPLMSTGQRVTAEIVTPGSSSQSPATLDEPFLSPTRVKTGRAKFATERVVATPAAARILDSIPGRNAG